MAPLTERWVPTVTVALIGTGLVLFFLVLPLLLAVLGFVLLWSSPLWHRAEKAWGTLVPLASLIAVGSLTIGISPAGAEVCSASNTNPTPVCEGGPAPVLTALAVAVVAVALAATVITLVTLWRRAAPRCPTRAPHPAH